MHNFKKLYSFQLIQAKLKFKYRVNYVTKGQAYEINFMEKQNN